MRAYILQAAILIFFAAFVICSRHKIIKIYFNTGITCCTIENLTEISRFKFDVKFDVVKFDVLILNYNSVFYLKNRTYIQNFIILLDSKT